MRKINYSRIFSCSYLKETERSMTFLVKEMWEKPYPFNPKYEDDKLHLKYNEDNTLNSYSYLGYFHSFPHYTMRYYKHTFTFPMFEIDPAYTDSNRYAIECAKIIIMYHLIEDTPIDKKSKTGRWEVTGISSNWNAMLLKANAAISFFQAQCNLA